ncbi:MAG: hypothetical protein PF503_02460, partial [Desulfobacula sp.]|nr:hypothetical protein [Desulfobacula sp.]
PLIDNSVTIDLKFNPAFNRQYKIEESVKESLEIALIKSNIFGAESSHPYRINVDVIIASMAPMSFGNFGNKLEIHYILFDENNNDIINETIHTVAESDEWYFAGVKRAQRARAVNISKNVLQFVDILQNQLNKK